MNTKIASSLRLLARARGSLVKAEAGASFRCLAPLNQQLGGNMSKDATLLRIQENVSSIVDNAEQVAKNAIEATYEDLDLGVFRTRKDGGVDQIAYIGTVDSLVPSGEVIGTWTAKFYSKEMVRDTLFWEAFADELKRAGVYYFIESGSINVWAARPLSDSEIANIPSDAPFDEIENSGQNNKEEEDEEYDNGEE